MNELNVGDILRCHTKVIMIMEDIPEGSTCTILEIPKRGVYLVNCDKMQFSRAVIEENTINTYFEKQNKEESIYDI